MFVFHWILNIVNSKVPLFSVSNKVACKTAFLSPKAFLQVIVNEAVLLACYKHSISRLLSFFDSFSSENSEVNIGNKNETSIKYQHMTHMQLILGPNLL